MKLKYFFLFASILILSHSAYAQTIYGIDVSHWQNSIDWEQVANDGKIFAWCKATESTNFIDPEFLNNASNGTAAGVVIGAYHFAHPDENSAIDEANYFLSIASDYINVGFLPPALDLENRSGVDLQSIMTSEELTAWVMEWLQTVENQTGIKPIIYTNSSFANFLGSQVSQYGLWIADPDDDPSDPPNNLGVWNNWLFKQYSWTGVVSGISQEVDLNVFNGNLNEFNNLIYNEIISQNNDNCENAILLQSSPVCNYIYGNVTNATPDSNFAQGNCDDHYSPLGAGVFYKFYATNEEHTIIIETTGDLDAVVVLYQGNDCNNLTEIQCEDTPGGAGVTTIMNVNNLVPGQLYWIRIYDYGSQNASDGGFKICITNQLNDNCSDAMTLQSFSHCYPTLASVTDATTDENFSPGSCDNYSGTALGAGVFFKFKAISEYETIKVEPLGDLDAVVVLYEGNDCDNLTEIQCEDTPGGAGELTIMQTSNLTPGNYYWIRVYDYGSQNASNGDFNICITHPTYDQCIGAQELQSNVECEPVLGSVTNATPDQDFSQASCDNYSGDALGAGVFYKFVATHSEHTITVSPLGDLDAVLVLYQGDNCGNLTEIQCEDTPGGSGVITQLTATDMTPGQTYWIRIYDYGSQNASNGDFYICITNPDDNHSDDIYISNAEIISEQQVNPSGQIVVNYTLNYSGNSNSLPNIALKYYLSEDCIIDMYDVLLYEKTLNINSNNPQINILDTLYIPSSTAPGDYYLIIFVDANNTIQETYENNNQSCLGFNVINNTTIDIYPSELILFEQSVYPGETLLSQASIVFKTNEKKYKNSNVYLYYYLSNDTILDENDIFLTNSFTNLLDFDTVINIQKEIEIQNTTTPGNYYIILSVDPFDFIIESNEHNNIIYSALDVSNSLTNEDNLFANILLYPNPTNNELTVSYNSNLKSIDIINLNGIIIKTYKNLSTSQVNILLGNLPSGLYILRIATDDGNIFNKKIIKTE